MNFEKYHGSGNDFIVIEDQKQLDYALLAVDLCKRRVGIGADGLIVMKQKPLEMLIFNADGSRAKMCGNGIRCFAHYVFIHRYISSKCFEVLVSGIKYKLKIMNEGKYVLVNMQKATIYDFVITNINAHSLKLYYVLIGVKHLVIINNEVYDHSELYIAALVNGNPDINIDFVKIINKKRLKVKTYERGVGWTLACGSGCCASFYMCYCLKLCEDNIIVPLKYDELSLYLENDEIMMMGSATKVFSGHIERGASDGKFTTKDYQ